MNKRFISLVAFVSVLFGICAAATSFMPVTEKVAIENHLENRLTSALKSVIGEGNFIVIIDVALNPERKESTRERWETRTKEMLTPSGRQEMLPGIPSKAEINRAPESSQVNKIVENMVSLPPDLIKKIAAIIVIDKRVKPDQIATVKNVAKIVLNMDEKRGDTLQTQQVELNLVKEMASKKTLASFISVDNIIKYVSIFLAIAILVIYFLNRISGMSTQAISSFKESRKKDPVSFSPVQQQAAAGILGGPAAIQSAFAGGMENGIKKPFSFITQNELQKLLAILPEEDSNTIADILSSLDARFSSLIISKMSGKLKDDVYVRLLSPRQLEPKAIREMETRIKTKLEGSLGGSQDLLAIIENSDSESAANILNSLKKTKPEEALAVRKQIILFGDIAKLSKTDVSKLLSRARIEDLAIIVQNSDENTKTALLENLPEETRSLVKEWLDLMPKQPLETVEASKKNLCHIAKALENSGEITINRS